MNTPQRLSAEIKLLLLLAISAFAVVADSSVVVLGTVGFALFLAASADESRGVSAKALLRLRWLALFVIGGHAISIGRAPSTVTSVDLALWDLELWVIGGDLLTGCLAFTKIACMVILSAWLTSTCDRQALSRAIARLLRVEWLAEVLVGCLEFAAPRSERRERGRGQGGGRHASNVSGDSGGGSKSFSLARVKNSVFERIGNWLEKSADNFDSVFSSKHGSPSAYERDIKVIGSCALAIMATKAMMILPGLPISPGHKNVFIIPIFIFAAVATHHRFGAAKVGLIVGILNFMLGYGKLGPLEILQFVLPGMVIDACLPLMSLVKRGGLLTLLVLCLVGALAGLARFSGNAAAILLTGAPWLLVVSMIPSLISQVAFSVLGVVLAGPWVSERAITFRSREVSLEAPQ